MIGSALMPANSKTRQTSPQRMALGRARLAARPRVTSPMNATSSFRSLATAQAALPTSSADGTGRRWLGPVPLIILRGKPLEESLEPRLEPLHGDPGAGGEHPPHAQKVQQRQTGAVAVLDPSGIHIQG